MTASTALIGYGVTVGIATVDSPSDFTDLVEVIEVTPPNQQVDDVEVTHMTSPDRTREYIAGLNEPGECAVVLNWVPGNTTDQLLLGLKTSGARRYFKITWPTSPTQSWTFLGHVKGYEPSAPIDDRMTVTATIKVDGANDYSYIA
jgi:hypothetical protein